MKLRCYCCGEAIDGAMFTLVKNGDHPVDRVFVMKPEHVEKLDDDMIESMDVFIEGAF